jgi:hypothetical protein
MTDLAHWLVDNTASPYSVNSLTGYLQSLGHKAPKSAVSDYLKTNGSIPAAGRSRWFQLGDSSSTCRNRRSSPRKAGFRSPRPLSLGVPGVLPGTAGELPSYRVRLSGGHDVM